MIPLFLRQRTSTFFIASTVFLGVLVDLCAYSILSPVLPFRLRDLGYAENDIGTLTGWLVAAYAGGLIIASPPAALIGAAYEGRRLPLLLALVSLAASTVLFMLSTNYTGLVFGRVLQGISGTGIWTWGLSMLHDSVRQEDSGRILGYVLLGLSCGSLIGPLAGGLLYNRLGWRAVFVFLLILIALDFILRLLVVEKHRTVELIRAGKVVIKNFEAPGFSSKDSITTDEEEKAGIDVESADTLREEADSTDSKSKAVDSENVGEKLSRWAPVKGLLTSPRALSLLYVTLLNGIVIGALLDTGMTLYLNERYGLNAEGAGLVFIASVVPAFIASPIAGTLSDKLRKKAKYPMLAGVILSVLGYALLAIPSVPLAGFCVFLFIEGFALSFFLTPVASDLFTVADAIPRGGAWVMALFNASFSIGTFIGPIVAGQVIAAAGILKAWWVIALVCAVIALVACPLVYFFVGGADLTAHMDVEAMTGVVQDGNLRSETKVDGDSETTKNIESGQSK